MKTKQNKGSGAGDMGKACPNINPGQGVVAGLLGELQVGLSSYLDPDS